MNSGLIRACRGPLVLIALGCLTAADTFWQYPISRTWPVLLILFGVLKLAEKATESHDDVYPQGPAAYAGYGPQGGYPQAGGFGAPAPAPAATPAASSGAPAAAGTAAHPVPDSGAPNASSAQ